MRHLVTAVLAASLAAAGAHAQGAEPDRRALSLAAGYVAAFTCSATFNAGRDLEAVRAGELARIYPDYRSAVAALPEPVIDRDAKVVAVPFADDLPPRVAIWREHLGCVQAPPGATELDPPLVDLPPMARGPSQEPWPTGDTAQNGPAPTQALVDAVAAAFDQATYGEGALTTAVLVVHEGRVIAERYGDGFDAFTPQRTWSVAKSIAATVIGAAVHQGLIDVEAPALIPAWSAEQDPRAEITVENLLHMASGLYPGARGSRTDEIYFGGGRIQDHALGAELVAPPGARFAYANNDTLAAMVALRAAIADDAAYLRFPFEALLHPIGMRDTYPETDWGGDFVLSSQVWTTARDLARLGLLYLNDGVWDGARLLPEGWARYVATPAPAQPTRGEWGYGAQFWLVGEAEGLPADAFAAAGHRGQYLVIVPSEDLVIVRRGFDESGGTRFDVARFAADLIAGLDRPRDP